MITAFAVCCAFGSSVHAEPEIFPSPEKLRPAVAFWKRVYLEVTTDAGLIHDSRNLGAVYEVVRFSEGTHASTRERQKEAKKRQWRDSLRRLASGKPPASERDAHAAATLEAALGHPPSARDYRVASKRLRFQLGQRNKFRAGIIRSGAWDAEMRKTLRQEGVPEGLIALPYVESSFNPAAYSKYGAAGAWQFMRSTGRRFLKIDYVVDERLDPLAATRAAARLLRKNYESLEHWPLAITAYNHGRAGMRRAARRVGTTDIAVIVEKHRSRSFGFASRNFYAQFLAAHEVIQSYTSYFGPLVREEPKDVDEIALPYYVELSDLTALGVDPETLKDLNPALRTPVFRGTKRIPKKYRLRLPGGTLGDDPDAWLAQLPEAKRYASQTRSRYYRVRRGDTLGTIAKRQGTTVSALVAQNGLKNRHRIRKGQVLYIPARGESRKPAPRARAKPKPAAPSRSQAPSPPGARDPSVDSAAPKAEMLGPWRALAPISQDTHWHRLRGSYTTVGPLETLGHFAEWLEIPTQRLRNLNRVSNSRPLQLGQKLELDFSRVTEDTFRQRRLEYHRAIEEDFFDSYVITGTIEHKLKRGDNLWDLSHETYVVPVWLLQRYNPDRNLSTLVPGDRIFVPLIAEVGQPS